MTLGDHYIARIVASHKQENDDKKNDDRTPSTERR